MGIVCAAGGANGAREAGMQGAMATPAYVDKTVPISLGAITIRKGLPCPRSGHGQGGGGWAGSNKTMTEAPSQVD